FAAPLPCCGPRGALPLGPPPGRRFGCCLTLPRELEDGGCSSYSGEGGAPGVALIPPVRLWPAAPGCPASPVHTLLSAPAVGVGPVAFPAGTIKPAIVPRKTASTSPLTARKAPFGLSASRRVASSAEDPLVTRPKSRAACATSQGPATTRPIIVRSSPG